MLYIALTKDHATYSFDQGSCIGPMIISSMTMGPMIIGPMTIGPMIIGPMIIGPMII